MACATVPLPVPFSPVSSTLASDGPTRAISSSTGCMAARLRNEHRATPALVTEQRVLRLEPLAAPQRPAKLDLGAQDGEQPLVVPGLLDEVARAAPHGLDRHVDLTPRRS